VFPNLGMSSIVVDENNIRVLPLKERYDICCSILKTEKDESKRWDAVWLAGEIAEIAGPDEPIFDQVADLMKWILENDDNGVVKHEACFQIAARNMREKIPDLINSAFHDNSGLVKHEALESLGLMRAYDSKPSIIKLLKDSNPVVSETARFVIKRLERFKDSKYIPSVIL